MSDNLSKLQDDCNEEIRNNVDKINSISEKISLLNKEINQIETGTGVEASSLRDERANLIDSLSKIVNVSYNETEVQNTNGDNLGGTNFSLYINGEKVVEGKDYRKLICESQRRKTIRQTTMICTRYTGKILRWSFPRQPEPQGEA